MAENSSHKAGMVVDSGQGPHLLLPRAKTTFDHLDFDIVSDFVIRIFTMACAFRQHVKLPKIVRRTFDTLH
jgi:hypothetical protein